MLATGSSRTNNLLLGSWMASAVVNLFLMYVLPGKETVPFHLVWIGLSVIYGFTVWRPLGMSVVLGTVALTTGYILAHHAAAGEIGWEETTEVPLMSAVFVVMVWHVRRRQQALAEVARLAEAERRRAEVQQLFVRFVSHELRTPITVARGYTELVRSGSTDPAVQEDTGVVLEELDKVARITQRLVTLMQLDEPFVRRSTDVDAELVRIVRRWEPTAERKWRVQSSIGYAPVNQERLEAALDCLLENAVKFTAAGDRIEVVGSVVHDAWVIEVTDSGIGMTAEQAAALTLAGGPLGHTTSGTGLGLAIARAVVESWGGRIRLTGKVGAGTTVTLRFPLRESDLALDEEAPVPAVPGA
jgi:signal transduction histidine kinase